MPLPAVVAGATGAVGRALVDRLLAEDEFGPVTILARRPLPPRENVDVRIVDFARLRPEDVPEGDGAAFCALGTTLKKAGSREAFREVDLGHVRRFARACRERHHPQFHVVSAMGADPESRAFYSRVKGEMEMAVHDVEFPVTCVYRPALLLTDREESRPAERAGILLSQALRPILPARWRAVPPETVAAAMVETARKAPAGYHVFESDDIGERVLPPDMG